MFLDSNPTALAKGEEFQLCEFSRNFVAIASTEAVYGAEHNLYQDYTVIKKLCQPMGHHQFTALYTSLSSAVDSLSGSPAAQVELQADYRSIAQLLLYILCHIIGVKEN
ncbi:hypothetical protein VM1G_11720 [Cytospora mali]|uniref:Uncharacterized protein n=1 Tax=Cytospora mali TaxID=578113 RepID=A0A194W2F1_CYTMA|nr:hypothetical protein VM1G_11720 [Valsa mali]